MAYKEFNNKKGFTLIELLITLSIMAIIALIAVPKFSGIIDKSKADACARTLDSLAHEYQLQHAMNTNDEANAETIAKQILSEHGTIVSEQQGYSGICPSGGLVNYTLKDGEITFGCSLHADWIAKTIAYSKLAFSGEGLNAINSFYNSKKDISFSIDSEAISSPGMANAFAKVNNMLSSVVDLNNSSWTVYHKAGDGSDKFYIYWTDTKISMLNPGDKVNTVIYEIDSNGNILNSDSKGITCQVQVQSKTTNNKTYNTLCKAAGNSVTEPVLYDKDGNKVKYEDLK